MEIQYFKSAWGDIKNSPRWFGKLCLLALLNFIPIFGQIVTYGYLYGWAREIAWGTHEPMPGKIFSNEDGKFWRRGWFVLVLTFVFALVPVIVSSIGNSLQGLGIEQTFFGRSYVATPAWIVVGSIVSIVGFIVAIVASILAWIGNMRISIYDRLSAGFQLGKIWKMLRRDTGGILRIFGMELLVGIIMGIVLSIVFFVLMLIVVSIGVAGLAAAGYSIDAIQYMTSAQQGRMVVQFIASAGFFGFLLILLGIFVTSLAIVFVEMLVIRAMGYWTMQFDVPRWGGQDDPLPFELYEDEQKAWSQPVQQPGSPAREPVTADEPLRSSGQPLEQPQTTSAPAAPVIAPLPVEPLADSASGPDSASDSGFRSEDPVVEYGEPVVVGANFIMTPEEIGEFEAEAEAQAIETVESAAQGAHGVEDGQAGDPDVGEDGEPHVGQPEDGEPQD